MSFTLILRGGGAGAAAALAPALVEELGGRGIAARVLSDGPGGEGVRVAPPPELVEQARALRAAGAAAVVLWTSGGESPLSADPDAVTIDWAAPGAPASPRPDAHGAVTPGSDARDGLAAAFAILEGLGYVPLEGGALSPGDDAELVERLKELGYL